MYPFPEGQMNFPGNPCSNGLGSQNPGGVNESMSPAAAAVAAVVGLRQQMQMASAGYHPDVAASFNMPPHCSNLNSNNNNGGSAGSIPMPKLAGSPAASGQLGNNGGSGVPMPRLASPAIPGMPNSMHGLSGLSGLHIMQSHLSGGQSSQQSGVTISPAHANSGGGINSNTNISGAASHASHASQSLASAMAHLASPSSLASSSAAMHIGRMSSPAGSVHDLRMTSPDDGHAHSQSPLDALEATGVNLAVSGMAYKAARGYSASPRSDLFHDDINDFVNAQRSCPSRLSNYKEPNSGAIKMEPLADCRGD